MRRSLSKLWVNGKVAGLEAGELKIDAPDQWRVRAWLGDGHPFRQVAGVSAVLEDGKGGARPGRAGRAGVTGPRSSSMAPTGSTKAPADPCQPSRWRLTDGPLTITVTVL